MEAEKIDLNHSSSSKTLLFTHMSFHVAQADVNSVDTNKGQAGKIPVPTISLHYREALVVL